MIVVSEDGEFGVKKKSSLYMKSSSLGEAILF